VTYVPASFPALAPTDNLCENQPSLLEPELDDPIPSLSHPMLAHSEILSGRLDQSG